MKKLLAFAAAVAIAAPVGMARAEAGAYPAAPVKIAVGFAAGGGTDLLARFYAKRLGEKLGQPFVIENRPGKGGAIAVQTTAHAQSNGYALVIGTTGIAVDAALGKSKYDWKRDLTPIAPLAYSANVLVVSTQSNIHSVADLIQEARRRNLTFGSAGVTTSMHMTGELFKQMARIEMTHVPYRGAAPAEQALLSGEIDAIFDNVAGAASFIEAGKFRPLAISSRTRSDELPNVPTIAESGLKGFETTGSFFLLAPARTPPAVLKRLESAVGEITREPETMVYLRKLHMVPLNGGSAVVTQMLSAEYEKWRALVAAKGVGLSE